jgi:hypothetical protein
MKTIIAITLIVLLYAATGYAILKGHGYLKMGMGMPSGGMAGESCPEKGIKTPDGECLWNPDHAYLVSP